MTNDLGHLDQTGTIEDAARWQKAFHEALSKHGQIGTTEDAERWQKAFHEALSSHSAIFEIGESRFDPCPLIQDRSPARFTGLGILPFASLPSEGMIEKELRVEATSATGLVGQDLYDAVWSGNVDLEGRCGESCTRMISSVLESGSVSVDFARLVSTLGLREDLTIKAQEELLKAMAFTTDPLMRSIGCVEASARAQGNLARLIDAAPGDFGDLLQGASSSAHCPFGQNTRQIEDTENEMGDLE